MSMITLKKNKKRKSGLKMEEMFDTYDKNGRFLGIKPKSFCHGDNPRCFHKAVWIWIVNDKGELLIQKRAACKKHHPNKYGAPSAGHVSAGETLLEACVRETQEELGLSTKPDDYVFWGEMLIEETNEFAETYLLKTSAKVSDMTLQEEEVAMVKYLTYDEFVSLIHSEEFCVGFKNYNNWICERMKTYLETKQ